MAVRRRIEITTETHEVWVVRRRARTPAPLACAVCAGGAAMLTPQDAARRAGVSQRTVNRWVEEGQVHFAETPDGGLFVCLAPLPLGDEWGLTHLG